MRYLTLTSAAAALLLSTGAIAQTMTTDQPPADQTMPQGSSADPTSPTDPAPTSPTNPTDMQPPADGTMAPPPAGQPAPPNPPMSTGAPTSATPPMAPMANTPPPPPKADYPMCSKTVQDGCINPGEARKSKKRK